MGNLLYVISQLGDYPEKTDIIILLLAVTLIVICID